MELRPPHCPYCDRSARLEVRPGRYRRGTREVVSESRFWECPTGCEGPDGERPFRFQDAALLRVNDEAARAAWRERFGEAMPPSGRPGRKSATRRTAAVQVRLTQAERHRLDLERGDLSLSALVREAVLRRPGSPRAPRFPLVETDDVTGPHRRAS